jgi:hypothetical protein
MGYLNGIPPRADDSQFIDMDRITEAQKRDVAVLPDEPLIAGVDLAWGGSDSNVVRFRRGKDARSIKPVVIPGEATRDSAVMVVKLAELLNATFDDRKIHTMFIAASGGAYVTGMGKLVRFNPNGDFRGPKCMAMVLRMV